MIQKSKSIFFSNAYKCAVFFENLTPNRNLTWIGALPDALKKATNQAEVRDILGADVTKESFNDLPTCDEKTANARCYTIVSDDENSLKDIQTNLHFLVGQTD